MKSSRSRLSQYYVLTTPLMIAADATDKRDNYARTPFDLSVYCSIVSKSQVIKLVVVWDKRLRCLIQSDLLFADGSLAFEHMAVKVSLIVPMMQIEQPLVAFITQFTTDNQIQIFNEHSMELNIIVDSQWHDQYMRISKQSKSHKLIKERETNPLVEYARADSPATESSNRNSPNSVSPQHILIIIIGPLFRRNYIIIFI
ncbi:MAG: hypothetical protein EZS28_028089 [Streblomastix strix]|uniref:Uncharacterized protein n=1 Tax=Streblomastix strix TaxID=222440 RepID=A0A5J4V1G4_9EUKA|nr:MAG: hypothetical protein EZS28_028089 [Streblomastix strix]